MKWSLSFLALAAGSMAFFGCATQPSRGAARPGPGTPPAAPSSSEERSRVSATALPEGEFTILVESVPKGGTVVVNGIPVGKTPRRVVLPGTARGFFRAPVSLKVRFIAEDSSTSSQTVEELLTPLDRIPAVVRFTPAGATRVAR